ncbi:MAG: TadE/TadG family type IV pilus assembly protein [Mycobacteriales bacterium]
MSPPRDPRRTRSGHRRAAAHRSRAGRQSGSATAELVIATPLLLLLLLGIVQFALWEHATHLAQAAAAQGLAAARVQGGGASAGQAEVAALLAQLGTGVLTDPVVTSRVLGGEVVVRISGQAEAVLPFWHLAVRATAVGPVEAFYPAGTTP